MTRPLMVLLTGLLAAGGWNVEIIAGTGTAGAKGDGGPALAAEMDHPFGIVRGPDGCLYFCEIDGAVIRKIDANGVITHVAGNGQDLKEPHEVRFSPAGELYVADTGHHRVCLVNRATGQVTPVAGSGTAGFAGDGGPALRAQFKLPISIQFDPAGDLFVCDIGNHRVRRVDMKTGVITTFAGTGQRLATPDGAAYAEAPLNGPRSLDCDQQGNLWLVLREGNQVLKLERASGTVHLVAGTGKSGYRGDGGPAKLATLSGPKGLSIAPDGNSLYLADTESSTIRVIDLRSGTINLVCGTGKRGCGPAGAGNACALHRPHALFAEADGTLLVSDSYNNRLLRLRHEVSR